LRGSRASLLIAKPGRRRFRWQLNRLLRREHLDIRANGYGYDHRAPGEGSASASELVARGSGRYRWHLVPYCGSHRANWRPASRKPRDARCYLRRLQIGWNRVHPNRRAVGSATEAPAHLATKGEVIGRRRRSWDPRHSDLRAGAVDRRRATGYGAPEREGHGKWHPLWLNPASAGFFWLFLCGGRVPSYRVWQRGAGSYLAQK